MVADSSPRKAHSVNAAVAVIAGVILVSRKKSKKEIQLREDKIKELQAQREEITEGDITLSKEKHICLVHKGPIEGYNWICPNCGAYIF